ncbi:DUF6266 family protein [Pedobacter sp. JY14-1]|uniref:DUF6266 family protein n=1 Tax=Pedobacter sp. JY14-1 TaxID=3034151 RepID=UPI0023E09DD4|nr:DUF6266 family protein [Pedobacter sp. JY14-1]
MGRTRTGVLGDASGRVDNVVFAEYRDDNVIRKRPKKSSKPATAAQLAWRASFELMRSFMSKDCKSLFNVGFQSARQQGITPFNKAFSLNVRHAVAGVYPALAIDYAEVLFAKGDLKAVQAPVLATTVDGQIDVSWNDNSPAADADDLLHPGLDKITVLAHCPVLQDWVIQEGAALRTAAAYDLQVPALWSGKEVQVWGYFVRSDGKKVSASKYMGVIEVQ